ncbi:unnamed protein product [Symbiodinium sp. CCMP2456]|nr:unnamed protein product [Symbiodinium sp. CCMP2456]
MTLSQLGLKFILSRTKTSGPGKRVGQLQAFVLRSVSLSGYDWIAAGYNLLQTDEFKIPRDFLCLRFTLGWEVKSREYMDGEGVACHIRRALAELKAPRLVEGSWGLSKTVHLVPDALLGFWSGHSARHFLPSLAAATGVDSDKRDFLGRWAVARSAGQAYVLTARQIIHAIQAHVCAALLEGNPSPGYVEEELFLQIQIWARAHGYAGVSVATLHKSLVWDSEGFWSLQGKYPAITVDPVHLARATAPGNALLQPSEEEPQERCVETIPLFAVTEDSADAICVH